MSVLIDSDYVNGELQKKADKFLNAVINDIIILDEEGNIKDSGINIDEVLIGNFLDGGIF